MTDTAGIDNPSALSDYDFLELLAFHFKVGTEGFAYAAEEYGPEFETEALREQSRQPDWLRGLYRDHQPAIDQWMDRVGMERAIALHDAHIDEAGKRRQDACLFGILCTDGHVINLKSRETRDFRAADMKAEAGMPGRRVPAALLERTEPGGTWTETPA